MSSLPASMKKIRSKMKALAKSVQNIIHQFFRRARADNSGFGSGIWPKFELIQAFMHIIVTMMNEDDRFKNEGARGQLTPQSLVRSSRILNSFELL